jgi:hypothetical protein
VEDRETKATAEKEGTEAEQETVASETVMEAREMSIGWSLEWDPTALGELRARSQRLSRGGEDKAGAKRSK